MSFPLSASLTFGAAYAERLAMKRNVDEQSLDCLNCKILRIKDETVWKYDPKGPYDIDQMLQAQSRRDEEKLNAALAEHSRKRWNRVCVIQRPRS